MILELNSNCRTPEFKWELWHICCLSSLADIIWPLLSRYPGKSFQKKTLTPLSLTVLSTSSTPTVKELSHPSSLACCENLAGVCYHSSEDSENCSCLHPDAHLPAGSQVPQSSGSVASQPRMVLSTVIGSVKRFSRAAIFHCCVKWVQTIQLVIREG